MCDPDQEREGVCGTLIKNSGGPPRWKRMSGCALMNVADKQEAAEIEEAWQTHLRDVMGHLDGETDREAAQDTQQDDDDFGSDDS